MDRMRALLLDDDDDRRAIERELHDGAQQQLVAVAVSLQLARDLVETDLHGAIGLLDETRAIVAEALDGLRELTQRIHPSLLDTQGLLAALRMAAAAAPLPTQVEGSVQETVPPEVAVTVFRCCRATLAAAEGELARATISVAVRDGAVEFEIVLVGGSVDAAALDLLAARVEVLGGSLATAPHRVAGRLPLAS
jgi:signal transduction histidine kinase